MIVNAEKITAMISIKNKPDGISAGFSISTDIVFREESLKIVGIYLKNPLIVNVHINAICISSSNQLNTSVGLKF